MDAQSLRVGVEILSAGVAQIGSPLPRTVEELTLRFLSLADNLSEAFVDNFARGLESVQSEEDGASALRERIAQTMHRRAVAVVRVGGEISVIAALVEGVSELEAQVSVASDLQRALEEDFIVPGDSPDELMYTALRSYAFAASNLRGLHFEIKDIESFVSSVHEVVCGVVKIAALSRADESLLEPSSG